MSYLADVEMPSQSEELKLELREDVDVSEIEDEVEQDSPGVEEDEVLPPPPLKKEKLKTEDIFRPKKAPPKNPVISPLSQDLHDEPIVPKLKPEKKKRQMSEKQLEALARGREKRAAAKQKKQSPQPKPEPTRPEPTQKPPERVYSQKEVEEMIFQGVTRYDGIRKKRKEEKRASQAKQIHEQKVFSTINSAMNNNDPWSAAFSF
tara:strand:- start:219 stop:833 length:615 start_codon:yes stop_codon:yes gene_type:complete